MLDDLAACRRQSVTPMRATRMPATRMPAHSEPTRDPGRRWQRRWKRRRPKSRVSTSGQHLHHMVGLPGIPHGTFRGINGAAFCERAERTVRPFRTRGTGIGRVRAPDLLLPPIGWRAPMYSATANTRSGKPPMPDHVTGISPSAAPIRRLVFPPSSRALGVVALAGHLELGCEIVPIDLGKGDQRTAGYAAMNPNLKMPLLEDNGFVLWESNAILFYLADLLKPDHGLCPAKSTWATGECAALARLAGCALGRRISWAWSRSRNRRKIGARAWPAGSCVHRARRTEFCPLRGGAERGAGGPRVAWPARRLMIADFSAYGDSCSSAERLGLPVTEYSAIGRWYGEVAALPAWRAALAAKERRDDGTAGGTRP